MMNRGMMNPILYSNDTPQPVWAWIYHSPSLWLISLSSDWETRITIADKNLGATQVYNNWDTLTEANCWKYYQRWNNHWFPFTGTFFNKSMEQVDTTWYWPGNYYDSDTFIYTTAGSYIDDWSSTPNNNLWWEITDTTTARQWPCNTWYHVCSYNDLFTFSTILLYFISKWIAPNDIHKTYLKMPYAWYISKILVHTDVWNWLYIWTSSYNPNYYYTWYSYVYPLVNMPRMIGCPIRPFKDTASVPNSERTKLL